MKLRAVITVTGKVQMAGFKSRVTQIALEFGLAGIAENLRKGAVRIIVEGESRKLERFLVALRKEGKSIGIRNIRVRRSPFEGDFKKFKIIRDENFEDAMSDRMDLGISYMGDMKGDIHGVKENTSTLKSEIRGVKENTSTIKSEIRGVKKGIVTLDRSFKKGIGGLDRHTGQHFGKLNRKYGTFGRQIKGMAKDIKKMAGTSQGMKKIPKMVEELRAMRELFSEYIEHLKRKETAEA